MCNTDAQKVKGSNFVGVKTEQLSVFSGMTHSLQKLKQKACDQCSCCVSFLPQKKMHTLYINGGNQVSDCPRIATQIYPFDRTR